MRRSRRPDARRPGADDARGAVLGQARLRDRTGDASRRSSAIAELLLKASPPRLVEEIYRASAAQGAARALELSEQLGLLEVMLPRLSHHLRSSAAALADTATARNLDALAQAIEHDLKPSHALALACLFVDLHLRLARRWADGGEKVDLLAELRQRGFARGDTEHMRLLMEALPYLMAPSRRTRNLVRRPTSRRRVTSIN